MTPGSNAAKALMKTHIVAEQALQMLIEDSKAGKDPIAYGELARRCGFAYLDVKYDDDSANYTYEDTLTLSPAANAAMKVHIPLLHRDLLIPSEAAPQFRDDCASL